MMNFLTTIYVHAFYETPNCTLIIIIIIIIIALIAINTRRVYAKFRHNTGKGLNKKMRLLMSTLKADRMV